MASVVNRWSGNIQTTNLSLATASISGVVDESKLVVYSSGSADPSFTDQNRIIYITSTSGTGTDNGGTGDITISFEANRWLNAWNIEWVVIEYSSDVTVQRIEQTGGASTDSISSVTLSQSWIQESGVEGNVGNRWPGNVFFNSASEIGYTGENLSAGHDWAYYVISWPAASVQEIDRLNDTTTSATDTISSVATDRTAIYAAGTSVPRGWDSEDVWALDLGSSTSLQWDRAGNREWDSTAFVVEYPSTDANVQRVSVSSLTTLSDTLSVTAVDPSISVVTTPSGVPMWGQVYTDAGAAQEAARFRNTLNTAGDEITITRESTTEDASGVWQLIEFDGASTTQSVDLGLATRTATAEDLSASAAGAVGVDVDESSRDPSAEAPTASATGSVSVDLGLATRAATAEEPTASAAGTGVDLGLATRTATAEELGTTVSGAASVSVPSPPALHTSPSRSPDVTVSGSVSVDLGLATRTATAQGLTASLAGATVVSAPVAPVDPTAQDLNATVAGSAAVDLGLATRTATAEDLSASAQGTAVSLGLASSPVDPSDLSVGVSGSVEATVDEATRQASAQVLQVLGTAALDLEPASRVAEALDILATRPGFVAVTEPAEQAPTALGITALDRTFLPPVLAGIHAAMIMGDVVEVLEESGRFGTVVDGFLTPDQISGLPTPVVCVYESTNQDPPTVETMGGSFREDLAYHCLVYIQPATVQDARVGLRSAESDLTEVLLQDRRRNGWAFDTIKSQGSVIDAAIHLEDADGGRRSRYAAILTGWRSSFYPLDKGDEGNVAHADYYLSSSETIEITTTDFAEIQTGSPLTKGTAVRFVAGTEDGRVRHVGPRQRTFLVNCQATVSAALSSAGEIEIALAINGEAVTRTRSVFPIVANEATRLEAGGIIDIDYQEELSVAISAPETGDYTFETLQITAVPKLA